MAGSTDHDARISGFETLLRPFQEVTAKNWQISLCKYLDVYIQHLQTPGSSSVNFTEAAILLQNSSTFYCRRVDMVYNWVREFCLSLAQNGEETEQGNHQKKKTAKKQLQTDNLEVLGFCFSDHNIDVNLDEIGSNSIPKVVLNSSVKAACKTNTSCLVYQAKNEEMGCKDEFRLHWRVATDGTLQEDFCYSELRLNSSFAGEERADSWIGVDPMADAEDSDHADMDVAPEPPDDTLCHDDGPPLGDPTLSPLRLSTDQQVAVCANAAISDRGRFLRLAPKRKENLWEECFGNPVNGVIKKFRPKKYYNLPPEMADEAALNKLNNVKFKKEGNTDIISEGEAFDNCFYLSMSELLCGKSQDLVSHKLEKEMFNKMRRKVSHTDDNNLNNGSIPSGENGLDDIDDDFDNEIDLDNNEPDGGHDFLVPEPAFNMDVLDSLARQTVNAVQYSAILKEKNDLTVAKRVELWHDRIRPFLLDAEGRSMFDFQEYGTRILNQFSSEGEVKTFREIVHGQPKEEISRYFLSSLMLANTSNVHLENGSKEELSKDDLLLTLLSRTRHHEELDDNVRAAAANNS